MPRIRCHYVDCVFVDDGYCGAAAVELDPETGCATYSPTDEADAKTEDWEGEEDEWDEEDAEEEEDDWEGEEDEI
jgi:hypothetical protein